MARGKYGARAESRNWQQLEQKINRLEDELQGKKKALHDLQKDWLRLKSIEKLFNDKADVIKELQSVRKELDDANGRLVVRVERERRWAAVMTSPENEQFMMMNRDLAADLIDLGYWPERLVKTRTQKRNTRSGKAVKQALSANGYRRG